MSTTDRRTLVLSLDGATWEILSPLVEDRKIPTIAALIEDGVSGPLQSVTPPVTAAAWTSFQTGVDPANHGVFTFHSTTDGGRSRTLVNANDPTPATMWDYLDSAGQTAISVNLPVTFPADSIPAHVVSGLLAPSFDHPDATSVRSAVEAVAPEYEVLRNPSDEFSPHTEPAAFIDAMERNAESRALVTRNLLSEYPDWDVCMMHIQSTDVLQHPMWKHLDTAHPAHDSSVKDRTDAFYETVDALLSEVIADAREAMGDLDIVLVSDHGFQGLEKKCYLDVWLAQNGFLTYRKPSVRKRALQAGLRAGKRADVFGLRHRLFDRETVSSLGDTARQVPVDWDSTVAWGYGNLYGYVYVQDLAEQPRVRQALESLTDPETGAALVRDVVDVAETYDDPVAHAPDLIVVPLPGVTFETRNDSSADGAVAPVDHDRDFHVGGHATDGIFVMTGGGIPRGETVESARLVDVMPTILHRHGVGVPRELDGTVLEQASGKDETISTIDPLETDLRSSPVEPSESVESRLENLGYRE